VKKQKKSNSEGMVRIIAGNWRSRQIRVVNEEGLRPTTDRVRETVFNWLQFDVLNSRCLDACAGSGALGFEALSRGAKHVDFVESNVKAIEILRKNKQSLGLDEGQTASIFHDDIHQFLSKAGADSLPYDIVFVDPPFDASLHEQIFAGLIEQSHLKNGTLIYCEQPTNEQIQLPDNWEYCRQKKLKNVSFGLIGVE